MTLTNIILPISYEDAKLLAMVFSKDTSDILQEKYKQYGNPIHCPFPIALNNGKFALCGDILTEVMPNGLYYTWFNSLESSLMDQIEILPWDDILNLIYREQPIELDEPQQN